MKKYFLMSSWIPGFIDFLEIKTGVLYTMKELDILLKGYSKVFYSGEILYTKDNNKFMFKEEEQHV